MTTRCLVTLALVVTTVGKLTDLYHAVIVTSPKGLEIGYMSMVTRQAAIE